tara:strand:+ start:6378 stop:8993 length:2616 start_codon:yes stop_codon:yes gene_type:complete
MQLKKLKRSFFLLFSIPAILLITIIISKPNFLIVEEDLTQKIISFNPGFSSFISLIDDGVGNDRFSIGMINKLNRLFSSVGEFIPKVIKYKLFKKVEFERIDINIDFSDYLTLMEDRNKAINKSILFNPSKVGASLKFNGKKYRARVRLKGDLEGHWLSKRRFSLRVNLKNNKTIFGFSDFSIQKPRERQHPYDHSFQSMLRSLDNLTSVHKFAHVFVNGEDWGIMDIEEHVSTKFLEKQNKKESIIVRFSNEEKWAYIRTAASPHNDYRISDPKLFLNLYNGKSITNLDNRKRYSYILKNRLLGNKIYDNDSFSKALIMSLVWNNDHTLATPNIKYYFNPYTLELEPITADQGHWSEIQKDNINFDQNNIDFLFSDEQFLNNLSKNIKAVKSVTSEIDNYLLDAEHFFPVDKKKNTYAVKNNLKKILSNNKIYIINKAIKTSDNSNNKQYTDNSFQKPTIKQASDFHKHLEIKHYSDGTLELYNLIPDTVDVQSIFYGNTPVQLNKLIIPSYLKKNEPTIIKTAFVGIQDKMFTVNSQYQGFDQSSKNNFTLIIDGIENPLLLDTAGKFDFINKIDDQNYQINSGNWIANEPIIINGNLNISPNTTLSFSNDSYILVKGALNAIGHNTNPISLNAKNDNWKGIYVINSKRKSKLRNLNISNVIALEDGLLKLTGAINFYRSDVEMENIEIDNIVAEDGINIIESLFSLNSVLVTNAISDGIDFDFSNGDISHSNFINIGGDALDFSGSNVQVNYVNVENARDKAISAGENSLVNINHSYFKDVGVGVASKDGSKVTLNNSKVEDYKLHAAMSYLKKDFYIAPSISINNSSVTIGDAYMRQKETYMSVNDIEITESELNVKNLYKDSVMSK